MHRAYRLVLTVTVLLAVGAPTGAIDHAFVTEFDPNLQ